MTRLRFQASKGPSLAIELGWADGQYMIGCPSWRPTSWLWRLLQAGPYIEWATFRQSVRWQAARIGES
jgi:hypothetical protein